MNKEKDEQRGGGVRLATEFTRIREIINKNGEVVRSTVEDPKQKREVKTMQKVRDRLR